MKIKLLKDPNVGDMTEVLFPVTLDVAYIDEANNTAVVPASEFTRVGGIGFGQIEGMPVGVKIGDSAVIVNE